LSTPISDTRQQDLLALTPLIRRVVAARVRDPQVVDDLVQETFARLLQAGPRLDDGALAPFAVVLARNVAVSFVRGRFTEARHRHRLVELTEPDRPEERALRQEEARAVAEGLARPPARWPPSWPGPGPSCGSTTCSPSAALTCRLTAAGRY
jgi:DNA-directed RNA polymerase specialized sigma24 family protein